MMTRSRTNPKSSTARLTQLADAEFDLQGASGGDPTSYVRCIGITKAGERCRLEATPNSSFCWSHAPQNAQARKVRAQRGGKAGGNGRSEAKLATGGELAALKEQLASLYEDVLDGRVDKGIGAVAAQIANAQARIVALEHRHRFDKQNLVSREQIEQEVAAVIDIMRRNVKDRETMRNINQALAKLIEEARTR
jgi:hypothetical protein